LTDKFEAAVFDQLFASNKAILLFDAFDEIAPRFANIFIEFVQTTRALTSNQMFIATRPHHANYLATTLNNAKIFKLRQLSKTERLDFMQHLLDSKNVADLQAADEKISEYIGWFCNPFILEIIADHAVTFDSIKISRICETAIEMRVKDLVEQKGSVANSDHDRDAQLTIWKVYQANAIRWLQSHRNDIQIPVDFQQLPIVRAWDRDKHKWTAEAVARHGIMFFDHAHHPTFVSRHYVFYFVCKYLIDELFSENGDDADDMTIRNLTNLLLVSANQNKGNSPICSQFEAFFGEHRLHEKNVSGMAAYLRSPDGRRYIRRLCERNAFWNQTIFYLAHVFKGCGDISMALALPDESPTTFQMLFSNSTDFQMSCLLFYFYHHCHDATGYGMRADVGECTFMDVSSIDECVRKFSNESDKTFCELQSDWKKMVLLFNFLLHSQIPAADVQILLENHFHSIFELLARNSESVRRFFVMLDEIFDDAKRQPVTMMSGEIFYALHYDTSRADMTAEFGANVKLLQVKFREYARCCLVELEVTKLSADKHVALIYAIIENNRAVIDIYKASFSTDKLQDILAENFGHFFLYFLKNCPMLQLEDLDLGHVDAVLNGFYPTDLNDTERLLLRKAFTNKCKTTISTLREHSVLSGLVFFIKWIRFTRNFSKNMKDLLATLKILAKRAFSDDEIEKLVNEKVK
jgi:hypothetical protein